MVDAMKHRWRSSKDAGSDPEQQSKLPLITVAEDEEDTKTLSIFTWQDPWLLYVGTTCFLATPALAIMIFTVYYLFGQIWFSVAWILHLAIMWSIANCLAGRRRRERGYTSLNYHFLTCIFVTGDILLLTKDGYPNMIQYSWMNSLIETDKTTAIEYAHVVRLWQLCLHLMEMSATMRQWNWIWLVAVSVCQFYGWETYFGRARCLRFGTCISPGADERIRHVVHRATRACWLMSLLLLAWSVGSLSLLFLPPMPLSMISSLWWWNSNSCDPLDATACWLPFPSFAHMVPDSLTATGYRVHLQSRVLPRLRTGASMNPEFLNDLDGFSTMAPIFFYLDGLQEAHEARNGVKPLHVLQEISQSITTGSLTLLVDVQTQTLVPHSAELDCQDARHPLVVILPAQALRYGSHYAVAVVNATNIHGTPISPTPGMQVLWQRILQNESSVASGGRRGGGTDPTRVARYAQSVVPALHEAAPWLHNATLSSIVQLLFDFVTASDSAQRGTMKRLRDEALRVVQSPAWGNWTDHVRTTGIEGNYCPSGSSAQGGRTVHAELEVPWFLKWSGPGARSATMSDAAVAGALRNDGIMWPLHFVKFVVQIPCSVQASALGQRGASKLRAVVEFGHEPLRDRAQATRSVMTKMANPHGMVVVAMDWRGMSRLDLPILMKAMGRPRLWATVRDNMIQGYVARIVLQEFIHEAMLDMDWMKFRPYGSSDLKSVEIYNAGRTENRIRHTFYGFGQGGVGYIIMSAAMRRLDGAVLAVSGAPLAMIVRRMLAFDDADEVLRFFYPDNRSLLLMQSLVQMALDAVEGAPQEREFFPPILLQNALGNRIVTANAAEALARTLRAQILPHRVLDPFGVPVMNASSSASDAPVMPPAILTELLYQKNFAERLDKRPRYENIHRCFHTDAVMKKQAAEFLVNGTVLDVCANNACVLGSASDC